MVAIPQVVVLRRKLDAALDVGGPVDPAGYARAADGALDTVEELIESGHAAEARPLARRAVEGIIRSLLMIDSSDPVGAACQRALGLYARACRAARPNVARLAGWLFQIQLDSPGWPAVDLAEFAEALGASGLAVYRSLVEEAWQKRDTDSLDEADIRLALTLLVIRERLAAFDGAAAGVDGAAPEGLPDPAAFLAVTTGGAWLVEFLVQAYVDGGRGYAALELRRSQLRAAPLRERYAKLRETALLLNRWAEVRPWALDILHAGGSGDEVVGALLDDGEADAAWEAAVRHGCAPSVWLAVARERARSHPADVLPGYRELIADLTGRTGRRHYREAVELLRELREVSDRCDRLADFQDFVGTLCARHHRKPALLDELTRL